MLSFAPLMPLFLLSRLASADSIATWYSKRFRTPQVILWDAEKRKIFYSLCNSTGPPIFPHDDQYALELYHKPLWNTTLAGSTGLNHSSTLVYYQEENGGIVQAIFDYGWPMSAVTTSGIFHVTNATAAEDWYFTNPETFVVARGRRELDNFGSAADIAVAYHIYRSFQSLLVAYGVFYIGDDAHLHGIIGRPFFWAKSAQQSPVFWPAADRPFARLAATWSNDTGDLWLYYMSRGEMTQVWLKDGDWQPYLPLEKFQRTFSGPAGAQSQDRLTRPQKIAVGVGISVGVIIFIVLTAYYLFVHTKEVREGKNNQRVVPRAGSALTVAPSTDMAVPQSSPGVSPSTTSNLAPRVESGRRISSQIWMAARLAYLTRLDLGQSTSSGMRRQRKDWKRHVLR
ncbi:hypothetical protein Micbo1qcDRAFT_199576 [Microdochium bolleyi]|uniref:Fucose-specific lectin n=1 Tax=Microdochium bolleyi TaxID=196109 RepID=A0A136JI40_9PEZI|nr:hypothetical protein Micbo1qcDRAFT_199576 [Microdochium bolleyi]